MATEETGFDPSDISQDIFLSSFIYYTYFFRLAAMDQVVFDFFRLAVMNQ